MEIKEFTPKQDGLFQDFFVEACKDQKIQFLTDIFGPWDHRRFVGAFIDKKLVGVVCYNNSSYKDPNGFGIGYVSTHEDFKNRGVAKGMLNLFFKLAKKNNKKVYNSWYEPEGQLYLKDNGLIERLAASHGVIYIDK